MSFLLNVSEKSYRPSKTAGYAAFFRALEYAFPRERRLVEDPFACSFLPLPLKLAARLSRLPFLGPLVPRLVDQYGPGARASGAARARLIDDHLVHALEKGLEQVVILGAGFDSRAYRIPGIRHVRVFEADRPGTLEYKRKKVMKRLRRFPEHVALVETDFNILDVKDTLVKAGLDLTRPAFFIWEGVTQYLTAQAVDQMLRFIGTAAPGSFILFTYLHRQAVRRLAEDRETRRIHRLTRRIGEPWVFGMDPDELPAYLKERGLELVEDVDAVEFRKRYMNPVGPHLRGYAFCRAALARVSGGESGPRIKFFRAFFR
jgi:methyltransferase (TIGR00027 family)